MILSYNPFPASYSVFRADRDCLNSRITHGGGVLIAVSNLLQGNIYFSILLHRSINRAFFFSVYNATLFPFQMTLNLHSAH
jgi:hypothetical protein